ncbi:hypothetical protein GCM10011581_09600 [Saccharopolyspora subtropica]|uniref:Uncharacterized protein n=1 Tax=Saccharopolyspora thermophila TaxID=89367 RepID=A0A917JL89_9PSEU|nr:hypothetical protein [Saccharopolyspora subtropica]GGI74697.1 hypothetical protein GCM10011581_09600 [Saccharopolyspora subtropica]
MRTTRALTATVLAAAALLGAGPAALAAPPDDVAVVDEPDTSGLHNKWTFAPLGVPVFGLLDSITGAPRRLL